MEYSLKFDESMTDDEIEEKSFRSLLPSESHRRINLKKRDHRDYSDEEASPLKTTLPPAKCWHNEGNNVLEHRIGATHHVEEAVPEWRSLSSVLKGDTPWSPTDKTSGPQLRKVATAPPAPSYKAPVRVPQLSGKTSGARKPSPLRWSKTGVELWRKYIKEHQKLRFVPPDHRSQEAFMQSGLSRRSPVVVPGTALRTLPAVQHPELAKAQSSLAFPQPSNAQPIPISPPTPPQPQAQSLSRPAPVGPPFRGLIPAGTQHSIVAGKARASLTQASNSGQVQQPGQTSFCNTAQSPSALQQMSEVDLKAFGSGIDVKPGTPPVTGKSTTPTSSPFRAASTGPNSQSNNMNHTIVYQKQFQPAAVRMTQPFAPQFAPQMLSQPNLVLPSARAPHTDTFPAPVQRPPVVLARQVPPPMTTGLMSRPRSPHVARGPCGSLSGVRGIQALAAMKSEQDMKSTQKFFSEQQQSKPAGGKIQKVGDSGNKAPEVMADSSGACQDKVEEKPNPAPATVPKPVRTGPIKPQAIKTEETKS